jgi:hypothetical protein
LTRNLSLPFVENARALVAGDHIPEAVSLAKVKDGSRAVPLEAAMTPLE